MLIIWKEEILENHRSVLLSNRWRTGSTITTVFLNYTSVLTNSVILLGLSNAPKTSFQIINIYSISTQNQTSELLWHYLLKGWCESDVDSEELYKPWYCDTIYSRSGVNQMWRTLYALVLWHYLLKGWCETDVDSAELYKPWYCDTVYSRVDVNQMWRTL